jgi:hypothetical protein
MRFFDSKASISRFVNLLRANTNEFPIVSLPVGFALGGRTDLVDREVGAVKFFFLT